MTKRWSSKKGEGEGIKWIRETLAYEGDDCRLWPMACDRYGYGVFGYLGEHYYAHQYVCEAVNGPKPSPDHEVAHTCGRGHDGCANKKHVVWKTHEDNMADIRLHGTAKKKGQPRRKLTDEQVVQIRAMDGTHDEIAAVFGVHRRTIGLIKSGIDRPDRPKRHRGAAYPEPLRSEMKARAKELRAAGMSFLEIGNAIGCSRLTATTFARCP